MALSLASIRRRHRRQFDPTPLGRLGRRLFLLRLMELSRNAERPLGSLIRRHAERRQKGCERIDSLIRCRAPRGTCWHHGQRMAHSRKSSGSYGFRAQRFGARIPERRRNGSRRRGQRTASAGSRHADNVISSARDDLARAVQDLANWVSMLGTCSSGWSM